MIPPGRPIVSDCDSTTYNVARYIDHYLSPLSSLHPSYIKDTYHFLDVIRPITVPSASFLFTIDIDSLYTNINTNIGLRAVREVFIRHPDPKRPDSEILQLLEICLTHNDFTFNNQWFLQIQGTAMGHRYAPSYANIYMSKWEREALAKCPLKPSFYFRYLDDIIGAWPHSANDFTTFIKILNDHHPCVNIKHALDPHSVNFLDTTIQFMSTSTTQKKLFSRVYFKPTDTHALLHKASYHPRHTFKGIIKSQILRFYRICSRVSDFNDAISILFRSLRSRHYSARFLRNIKRMTLASLPPAPPSIISSPSYNRSRRGIINVTITHAVRIPLPTILHHPVWSRSSPCSPIHRHNSMDFLNRTSHR